MLLILLVAVILIPWMAYHGLPPWWVWSAVGIIVLLDGLIFAALSAPQEMPRKTRRKSYRERR